MNCSKLLANSTVLTANSVRHVKPKEGASVLRSTPDKTDLQLRSHVILSYSCTSPVTSRYCSPSLLHLAALIEEGLA